VGFARGLDVTRYFPDANFVLPLRDRPRNSCACWLLARAGYPYAGTRAMADQWVGRYSLPRPAKRMRVRTPAPDAVNRRVVVVPRMDKLLFAIVMIRRVGAAVCILRR